MNKPRNFVCHFSYNEMDFDFHNMVQYNRGMNLVVKFEFGFDDGIPLYSWDKQWQEYYDGDITLPEYRGFLTAISRAHCDYITEQRLLA